MIKTLLICSRYKGEGKGREGKEGGTGSRIRRERERGREKREGTQEKKPGGIKSQFQASLITIHPTENKQVYCMPRSGPLRNC